MSTMTRKTARKTARGMFVTLMLAVLSLALPRPGYAQASFPLKSDLHTDYGYFHMISHVTLSADGRAIGTTEVNVHRVIGGACGKIWLRAYDAQGNVLIDTGADKADKRYCLNGGVETATWDYAIPAQVLARTTRIEVLHGESGKGVGETWLGEKVKNAAGEGLGGGRRGQ